ncbi:Undecaprenyl pyrophosphate synthetase family protein, putative [Theobroma cacao]|uniref:Undecaprenyl pyrophosphate synthetase family protein, putative n=1 Tax=Theobroma cacao TaxID=3641 RepID=A0A061DNS5_THECC|nr:Undecaprenyl pyrophosphate synthetase family protein, putative [Theobroma cacao]
MDLMLKKVEGLIKEESIVNRCGVRVYISGNLKLLSEPVRLSAERAMLATAKNCKAVLSILYLEGMNKNERNHLIKLTDIEKNMYMVVAPDPDIKIHTSSETRLSNFLIWQSAHCYLYSPSVLWTEIGFRQFLWAILNFQRIHFYLDKKRKLL